MILLIYSSINLYSFGEIIWLKFDSIFYWFTWVLNVYLLASFVTKLISPAPLNLDSLIILIVKKAFLETRVDQRDAIQTVLKNFDYEKQYKITNKALEKIFQVCIEGWQKVTEIILCLVNFNDQICYVILMDQFFSALQNLDESPIKSWIILQNYSLNSNRQKII